MEQWSAGGAQSAGEEAQTQAAIGLLVQASRALRESRTQLDRLYGRVSELLRTGRFFPKTGGQQSAAELSAEIKALGTEAEAVLRTVATHANEAAKALSGASSAVHHPLRQMRSRGAPTTSHPAEAGGTLDQITRQDDVRYRY